MKRNDWIGLLTSLVVHALVLLLLAFKHVQLMQPPLLGFIEVELGPWAEGRPVQQAEQSQPDEAAPEPQPAPPEEEKAALPEQTRPVELPEQARPIEDEQQLDEPEETRIAPEPQNNPAEVKKPEPEEAARPIQPKAGGQAEGTAGAATGNEGEGQEDQRSAPYLIEGLDRTLVQAPLPVYAEKVNAIIRVRIVVDPQGRIVQAIPLIKGNPALERAVLEALRRWRFNPLPPGVPLENQTGVITFRFRLE
ncbi:MAG: TonB family protein [Rhodothermus sp.]|nr:TonB family protein [Rhodothermus sp.]